jgi:bla regulator protein BlaR1
MMPGSISPIANHLWQSTVFAGLAGLLTLALRKNRAPVRYGLWLAASVKFLIPFSMLVSLGSHVGWRTPPAIAQARAAFVMEEIGRPFTAPAPTLLAAAAPSAPARVPAILACVWFCGFATGVLSWLRRWRRIRAAVRAASPLHLDMPDMPIRVMSTPVRLEPGVFGIRRPVLLLPAGIADRLTPAQLEAIVAHELCHVRRRDNLAMAVHMAVEALFWFHPLVWWIETRLVEERERACDEEVLRAGSDPEVYAEGILNVCKFYLESPLVCVSGVTGADLKKRIEAIMTHGVARKLTLGRKLLLTVAGMAAIGGPIMIGLLNSPQSRAQSPAGGAAVSFAAASIKPSVLWKAIGEGSHRSHIEYSPASLSMWNVSLGDCVQWAYGVKFYQVSGPNSLDAERYDILAKASAPASVLQLRSMLQQLLAERFRLTLHRDTRELPVYELIVAKSGPKLPAAKADGDLPVRAVESLPRVQDGSFVFQETTMAEFAEKLSLLRGIERPVLDRTGIKGVYDIILRSAASAILQENGPSLLTLVQEQLGLKLAPARDPIEVLVIDHSEKPSEN